MDPHGLNHGFLDGSSYIFIQVAPQLFSRSWVNHVPEPLILRKSDSAENRIRDLSIYNQELWPLDHRGTQNKYINKTRGNCVNWSLCFVTVKLTGFWNVTLYSLAIRGSRSFRNVNAYKWCLGTGLLCLIREENLWLHMIISRGAVVGAALWTRLMAPCCNYGFDWFMPTP
jgi:hypothetical protein